MNTIVPWDRDGFARREEFVLSRQARRQMLHKGHQRGRLRQQGGKRSSLTRRRDRFDRRTQLRLYGASKARIARMSAMRRRAAA